MNPIITDASPDGTLSIMEAALEAIHDACLMLDITDDDWWDLDVTDDRKRLGVALQAEPWVRIAEGYAPRVVWQNNGTLVLKVLRHGVVFTGVMSAARLRQLSSAVADEAKV